MAAVTLEVYAQILARLAARRAATVVEVLAERGLSLEDFARDEPELRAQIRDAWARRKGIAAMKLAAAICEELDQLGPLGVGAAPQALHPEALVQVPSFMAPRPPPPVDAPPVAPMTPLPSPPARALSSTAIAGASAPAASALPFVAASPLPSPPPPVDASAPAPRREPVASGTVFLGDEPAAVAAPEGIVALTPQQYASLRAELQLHPTKEAEILRLYQIPLNRREALDAYWRQRFDADPVLRMTFARAYGEYVAWLKANASAPKG
jgi:hypothetical protein